MSVLKFFPFEKHCFWNTLSKVDLETNTRLALRCIFNGEEIPLIRGMVMPKVIGGRERLAHSTTALKINTPCMIPSLLKPRPWTILSIFTHNSNFPTSVSLVNLGYFLVENFHQLAIFWIFFRKINSPIAHILFKNSPTFT